MSLTKIPSLYIGDSNQLVINKNQHYNLEEYKTVMQFKGPWAVDKICEIHIMKNYNIVTCYLSWIEGEADTGDVAGIQMESVPFTLPGDHDLKNTDGKLPQRFLPKNTFYDVTKGGIEAHSKTFSVPSLQKGVGFNSLMTIYNAPQSDPTNIDNGVIKFGYNVSNQGFVNPTASIQPTSLTWLTDSNLNVGGDYSR